MTRRIKRRLPSLPPIAGGCPTVAILGRPNVGKSTLFNRLSGQATAIVEDHPGVTRDRLYADTNIDTRRVTLVDMGGFEASPEGAMATGISKQCLVGVESADIVLFVVDGRHPPTVGDLDTAKMLRKSGKPAILVANKIDSAKMELDAWEVSSLGIDKTAFVSALHGRGISDLEDMILDLLPEEKNRLAIEDNETDESLCKVAIIGRPNSGKSSLINKILGEERLLTLDEPGTTRDPVDSYIERSGVKYVFIDTAGIRRKRGIEPESAEKMAVDGALKAIERSHVAVVLVDAAQGIVEQDAKVLGMACEKGRAVVLGFNKWDLTKKEGPDFSAKLMERSKDTLSFVKWLKTAKISALTGLGIDKLFKQIDSAFAEFQKRIQTSEVNRLFEKIIDHHPPPMHKGKTVKLYYATQTSVRPPTFVVQTNHPDSLHFSYKRYIENRIREAFGFEGTSIRIFYRKK